MKGVSVMLKVCSFHVLEDRPSEMLSKAEQYVKEDNISFSTNPNASKSKKRGLNLETTPELSSTSQIRWESSTLSNDS